MNELMIFNNPEFGEIRTVEVDGEPWLVGKDVARALGYKDTINALKSHVDEEDKKGTPWCCPMGCEGDQEKEMGLVRAQGITCVQCWAQVAAEKLGTVLSPIMPARQNDTAVG